VTKIHHDVFICYFFFSAPFDTPPSAGGREEMVSLLEEGLRSDDSDEYQTPSEEVTNINYHVFILLNRVFYLSKSSPLIPLLRHGGGKCFF
jgi:hypothetical protein